MSKIFKLLRFATVWTVVTVSMAKDGIWFMFNFPLASNEAIPLACPISLFIKFIPDVKVDKAVERLLKDLLFYFVVNQEYLILG